MEPLIVDYYNETPQMFGVVEKMNEEFEEIMYVKYNKTMWSNNIIDIIYALEAIPYNILALREKEGKIVGIKYEPKEKNLKVR